MIEKINGFSILTTLNHGAENDPHPQYAQKEIGYTVEGVITGQWTKIAKLTITAQWQTYSAIINILGGHASSLNSPIARLYFKAVQNTPLGQPPSQELVLLNNKDIYNSNFQTIITQNDDLATVIEIYMKNDFSYEQFSIKIQQENSKKGLKLETYKNATFTSTLPTGTSTFSKYISQSGFLTSSGDGTTNYTKIASIDVKSNSAHRTIILDMLSLTLPDKSLYAKVLFKVYQNGSMPSNPVVEVSLLDIKSTSYLKLQESDFVAVITSTTSSYSTVDLYVKNVPQYFRFYFNVAKDEGDKLNSDLTIYENYGFSVLPNGTQVVGEYAPRDKFILRSSDGSKWKITVDNSGVLSANKL